MAKNMGSHLARLQKVQIFDVNAPLILNTSLAASRSFISILQGIIRLWVNKTDRLAIAYLQKT